MKINPKNIIRFRLSIENVMVIWMYEFGENTRCTFTSDFKFSRTYILLSAEKKVVNSNKYQDGLTSIVSDGSSLLPRWVYFLNTIMKTKRIF